MVNGAEVDPLGMVTVAEDGAASPGSLLARETARLPVVPVLRVTVPATVPFSFTTSLASVTVRVGPSLSKTVRLGNRRMFWNVRAMPHFVMPYGLRPASELPAKWISPAAGA